MADGSDGPESVDARSAALGARGGGRLANVDLLLLGTVAVACAAAAGVWALVGLLWVSLSGGAQIWPEEEAEVLAGWVAPASMLILGVALAFTVFVPLTLYRWQRVGSPWPPGAGPTAAGRVGWPVRAACFLVAVAVLAPLVTAALLVFAPGLAQHDAATFAASTVATAAAVGWWVWPRHRDRGGPATSIGDEGHAAREERLRADLPERW